MLKDDISQQAAMAALMCDSAGWTQVGALLNMLSADAAAGTRPELKELLKERCTAPRMWYSGCSRRGWSDMP